MAMGGQRQAQAALPPGKETRYPLYRTIDRPRGWSGRVRNMSRPPRFDLRTVGSSFTDYAVPILWSVLSNSRTRIFWLNFPTSQFCRPISSPLFFLLLCCKANLQRCCVAVAHVSDMWYPVLSPLWIWWMVFSAHCNASFADTAEYWCPVIMWFSNMQILAENSPVRNSETRIAGVFRALNVAVYGPGVDSASKEMSTRGISWG